MMTTHNRNSLDYAIECIQNEKYSDLLIDINKFIDTKLKNSIKNIYAKYDLSNYKDILEETLFNQYKQRIDQIDSQNSLQKAMVSFINHNKTNLETIRLLSKVVSEKNSVIVKLFLAITYARDDRLQDAIDILETSDHNDTHTFIYLYIMKKNYNSNENIDKYLNLETTLTDCLNNAILLRLFRHDWKALQILKQYNQKHGIILDDKGISFTNSNTHLNNSELYSLLISAGISHFQRHSDDMAINYFNKAINIPNINTFEAQRRKAICFSRSNNTIKQDEAVQIFRKLSKEHALDNDIHRNLAVSLANKYLKLTEIKHQSTDETEVMNSFDFSIQNNPFHSPNYFDRGSFYFHQGDFAKSLQDSCNAIKYADYKLKYYRQYIESFLQLMLKRGIPSGRDWATFKKILDMGLTQTYNQGTIIDYLYLRKIASKYFIHKFLEQQIQDTTNIRRKIRTFIIDIDNIKRDFSANNKRYQNITHKLYETSLLLCNYIEDLTDKNTIYSNSILSNEDLTQIKLSTADKCLFRGMNRTSWDLKPNFYRDSSNGNPFTMLENFKREALGVSNNNYDHYKTIDWLGLMQHHGALTKFLDWTQSCSISLFFAMHLDPPQDSSKYGIPCLYTLEYKNIKSMEDMEKIIDQDYATDTHNEEALNKDEIVLFAPRISHKRADIQKSMFTYHRSNKDLNEDHNYTLKKYLISPMLIEIFTKILEKDHINIATVYPDLQNLSNRLKDKENINNLEFSYT